MFLRSSSQGEVYILSQSLLWSLFPIITKILYTAITPMMAVAFSSLFAALFFGICLLVKGTWHELTAKHAWTDILLATLFIGVLFYMLKFIAVRYTFAGNISLVGLMEIFFTFLTLNVILRKEQIVRMHGIGALCMVIGAVIVLLPKAGGLRIGDFIMLAATAMPPLGNMFAKRARESVGSECIMFYRSLIAGILLFVIAFLVEPLPSASAWRASIGLLFFHGFVLLGFSKLLWMEGIHRISISRAISLASISPAFTLIFAYFFLDETIHVSQVIGFIPMIIGVHLLTKNR